MPAHKSSAHAGPRLLSYGSRPVDWYRINELKHSVSEERLEQVREIDGEQAYEKMRRAVEKASQVERARQVERSSKLPARKRPERRGPERDIVSRQNCADNCNSSPLTMTPTSNHSGGGALQRLLKERQREERVT